MASPPTTSRTRRNRLRRIVPAVLGVAIGALALSGCVSIKGVDLIQEGSIGDIDITVTGCGSKANTTGCELGNSSFESNDSGTGQVLLGMQMDARFVPPATFKTDFSDSQPFTASPSYTAELTRLAPPDAAHKWVGYISDVRTYTPGKVITAHVPVVRPLFPDGSPSPDFVGVSFAIGSRIVSAADPATRPVACGTSLTTPNTADFTICLDDNGVIGVSGFNDFAFLTPAPVTVQPGQTAVIPVTGKFTGPAAPAVNFALATSTTLPGATALTNVPTLAPPGESTTSVTVSVPVPASAKPGSYAVTLTGTLATGETRSATGTLIVAGPGGSGGGGGGTTAGKPLLSNLKVSRKTIFNGRGAASSVISVTLSDPGRLQVLLDRQAAGRRKGRRCVAPTSTLRLAGAPRCTRFIRVSSLTKTGLGAGLAKVSVSGRSGGRPRVTGTYRVTLTSLTGAGVASLPLITTLTITR